MVNVTLTRVRIWLEYGRQDIAFDGFVRPVLLDDVTLPRIVTPSSVIRHSSKKLHKETLAQGCQV